MNKIRRKILEEIHGLIEEAQKRLETVCGEEQDAMDNMPESLQESERYQTMEDAVSEMESAIDNLQDALDSIEVAMA